MLLPQPRLVVPCVAMKCPKQYEKRPGKVVCFAGGCQEVKKQVLELVCEVEDYSKMNTRVEASNFPPSPIFPARLANILCATL
jgi:hypothetical protein